MHRDDSPVLTEEFVTLVRLIGYKFTGNYFYTYFYLTLPPVDIVTVPHSLSCIICDTTFTADCLDMQVSG